MEDARVRYVEEAEALVRYGVKLLAVRNVEDAAIVRYVEAAVALERYGNEVEAAMVR